MLTLGLFLQAAAAFAATFAFSMLFNVPKKELAFCGLTGACGWLVCHFIMGFNADFLVLGTFAGTLALTWIARILSYSRRTPVLVYLIGGILPLVPGAGIYHTMYELMMVAENSRAAEYGLETAKITGVISVGIICILSMPRLFFDFRKGRMTGAS